MSSLPRRFPLVGALALALVACEEAKPGGQVIAVVNGEEITVGELNEEARSRGLAIARDKALRDQLVKDLVDRKLLVQRATKEGMDRTPRYLLSSRRAAELLLAQELLADAEGTTAEPSEAEVQRFIAAWPERFGGRALISVDRISLPTLAAPLQEQVAAAATLDDAEKLLRGAGVTIDRQSESWDTATMFREWVAPVRGAVGQGPILLTHPGRVVIARVLAVVPQPVPSAQQRTAARQWIDAERNQRLALALVAQQRRGADIRIQPGFAPAEGKN